MQTTLSQALEQWAKTARHRLDHVPPAPGWEAVGRVGAISDGIAQVTGLSDARADELLSFPGGVPGLVLDLAADQLGCLLLGPCEHIQAGDVVRGTGRIARVPVGDTLLGRVIDPLGRPLDGGAPLRPERQDPVEKPAPPLTDRGTVVQSLATGTTIIDALYPIGRGQRELIVGDRGTGKTTIAVDAMLRQKDGDVIPVYCAIGQRASSVREVVETLRAAGMLERSVVVVAPPDAPPGLQWLAPSAAMTMAEYFRDTGRHVLLVLDDLTKHAAMHRQICLLLRRPPGREAFPGDIFHLHAHLLERAAKLSDDKGGGSLTCLPVVETQAGNMSAYIPTNLISITDGQIVLDARQFQAGQRPAVDVGRSVSRVGARTQPPSLRSLAERLKLEYAQFLELEAFTRFGGLVDERTRIVVDNGRRLRTLLQQRQGHPRGLAAEVALLLAHAEGLLAGLDAADVAARRDAIADAADAHEGLAGRLTHPKGADEADLALLRELIQAAGT